MMSRCAVPTQTQIEALLEILEEKRWLGTGHARTNHDRDRTRAAWQDVATRLNSDANGCTKTWQQWAKYWKDKKAAVKRKASQIRLARQRNDGDDEEEIVLSSIEERILAIMGGEGLSSGNTELQPSPTWPEVVVEKTENPLETEQLSEPESAPESAFEIKSEMPSPSNDDNESIDSASSRRRFLTARRRLHHREPTIQMQPQMNSVSERLIAIEERRVHTERILAENQREMVKVLKEMSEAWSRQSSAMQELVRHITKR